MTRGHRSASNCNTTTTSSSPAAASSSTSSSNNFQQQQTPRRGNKTLGWYLGDKLNTSSAIEGDSCGRGGGDSPSTNNSQMAPQSRSRRRGSLIETMTTTPNSSRSTGKLADEQQQQNSTKIGKRHSQQQQKQSIANSSGHRPRANSSAMSVASKKTPTQPNGQSGTASNPANDSAKQTAANQCTPQRIGKGPNSTKEDYWYYDEVSDGFYYEHNGTRGWRKRRPEWGTVEQMKGMTGTEQSPKRATEQQQLVLLQQQIVQKQKAMEAKTSSTSSATVPSLLAPQQLSKFVVQQVPHEHMLSPTPANFKYYDPTTDGFYYEMASFDGWKRRQPQSGGVCAVDGTSPPHAMFSSSLSSSYCSPLLGGSNGAGQQTTAPSTAQQQQKQWHRASPGLTQQTQQAPHRKVQPLHYQAYQQPAPQLNPAELQEMIMLAQQNHQHQLRATAAVPSSCCCSQLSCCPNSNGNGTAACCCTNIAAMAAQLVLKQQQKLAEQNQCYKQQNIIDNNNSLLANELPAEESNKLSSTDSIRSLLDMDTKLSLLGDFVMDGSNQQKVVRPTVLRMNHQHHNNSNGINGLKLPRNNWDTHQLGGIVPSPPPLIPSLQAQNMERRSSSHLIMAVAANNGNTTTSGSKTNTALSTGSFEEPYEFYWSGDEAGSEVVPLGTVNGCKQQQNEQKMMGTKKEEEQMVTVPPLTLSAATTTAASVSSVEEDDMDGHGMLDEYMAEMMGANLNDEKQRKIAPIGSEANHFGSSSKKRPNTLKLTCPTMEPTVSNGSITKGLSAAAAYEPISPGEILRDDEQEEYNDNNNRKDCQADSPPVSYLPYQFNVDKFIADVLLPPSQQQQQSLLLYNSSSSNNNNLFTPLAQQPLTADSPLFTPIVPSLATNGVKDPWYYGKGSDIAPAHPLKQHMDSANPWAYP